MIRSFLTRGLVMAFGYAYPAYECYKTVEKNKPEIDQLRFWCQYWILVAVLTVFERFLDAFISWVPMYSEAKLAFFIYLWYPKTKGTTYVYDSFFKPYLSKHEMEIDRNLLELRARAGDIAVLYWRQAISYGQTRIFEILQYVSAQSTSRSRPRQQQEGTGVAEPPPAAPTHQPATTSRPKPQQPPSPTSNAGTTTTQHSTAGATTKEQNQAAQEADSAAPASPAATMRPPPTAANQLTKEATSKSTQSLAEAMQAESSSTSSASENMAPIPTPSETVMEEAIRVTRGRLRKTRASTIK